jgi:hypothetical protein
VRPRGPQPENERQSLFSYPGLDQRRIEQD